jgi:hypothetical protein
MTDGCVLAWVDGSYLLCGSRVHDITVKKSKGKFHPRTDCEDPQGEYRYKSILSLTSAPGWGGWSAKRLGRFSPRK